MQRAIYAVLATGIHYLDGNVDYEAMIMTRRSPR
jgi:hypothetical protein